LESSFDEAFVSGVAEGSLNYSVEGKLALDGHPLDELCRRFGSPLFVASRAKIQANVHRFLQAFAGYGKPVIFSYSAKTNSNLGVLEILRQTGVYAGVCSALDYAAARRAGFPPERIIFDGLAKSPEALEQAIGSRISLINVESWQELEMINEIARRQGHVMPVGLRIRIGSPSLHLPSAKSLLGISYDRFGFDLKSGLAHEVLGRIDRLPNVQLQGLHVHEGSHYRSAEPYLKNFKLLFPLIQRIHEKNPRALKYLNLGGGFGVPAVAPRTMWDVVLQRTNPKNLPMDLNRVAAEIAAEVTQRFDHAGIPLPTLVFEPGRAVVGDAFVLVCRILLRKEVPGSGTWLILDAGTNLFPYLLTFSESHCVFPVQKPLQGSPAERVHLAGPLLYSSDILMRNCRLPRLEPGSLVALLDAGAYTLAYSNQFLYPRPAVVLLDGHEARVIRQTETAEDVLRQDRMSADGN